LEIAEGSKGGAHTQLEVTVWVQKGTVFSSYLACDALFRYNSGTWLTKQRAATIWSIA